MFDFVSLVFYLFLYLFLLVVGAWCVSEGGDILGDHYDATIVGGFIIAWLNTLPETIFFLTALQTSNPHFAVGAMSGSVIVVCSIAVGCCVYIGSINRESKSIVLLQGVRKQAEMLGYSLIVLVLMIVFGYNYITGFIGVGAYLAFLIWTLFHKHQSGHQEISKEIEKEDRESNYESDDEESKPLWKGIAFLCAGGLIIYLFSEPFISIVVGIGESLGIGPLPLAFFLAPIASESPEILESISLSRKGKTQNINIAFSNLVGGTISKTTLLCGLLCIYSSNRSYEWISPSYTISFILVMISAGSTALFSLQKEHKAIRGVQLVILFLVCAAIQFVVAQFYGIEIVEPAMAETIRKTASGFPLSDTSYE